MIKNIDYYIERAEQYVNGEEVHNDVIIGHVMIRYKRNEISFEVLKTIYDAYYMDTDDFNTDAFEVIKSVMTLIMMYDIVR